MIFSKKFLDQIFKIGLFLKGLNGISEIIGGVLLIFVSPSVINNFILIITQHEIGEDPKDIIANSLIKMSQNLSISSQLFWAFYLLTHGILKIFLIISLLKRKLWAFPAAIFFFLSFLAYQIYQYAIYHSIGMLFLIILDSIIVILTWFEYRELKKHE